jgi:hypothetical protein
MYCYTIRPLRAAENANGTTGTFAKFEVDVPLFVTAWAPVKEDSRIHEPALLKDLSTLQRRNGPESTNKIPLSTQAPLR